MPYDCTHMWNLYEQTELTGKMGADSLMESWMTAVGVGKIGCGGTEQKGKRIHGQQCGDWG